MDDIESNKASSSTIPLIRDTVDINDKSNRVTFKYQPTFFSVL